jgi:hypothetical protein
MLCSAPDPDLRKAQTVNSNFDPGFRIHGYLMHRLVDNVESAGF